MPDHEAASTSNVEKKGENLPPRNLADELISRGALFTLFIDIDKKVSLLR